MPGFELTLQAHTQGVKDGKPVRKVLPPSVALRQLGPILQVTIGPTPQFISKRKEDGLEPIVPIAGMALIDTGASASAVDEEVCKQLGLNPTGSFRMAHAGGSGDHLCYPVQVIFPGTDLPPLAHPRVASVKLRAGQSPYIMLLGRDLLQNLRFVYNGPMGRIEIYT